MTTAGLLTLIEDLRREDMVFILFGKHLTRQGREQIGAVLEREMNEFILDEYADIFDCVSSAAEIFRRENGQYPESEEDYPYSVM